MWMKKEGTDELKVKSSKVKPSNGEITRRVRRLPLRSDQTQTAHIRRQRRRWKEATGDRRGRGKQPAGVGHIWAAAAAPEVCGGGGNCWTGGAQ